MIEVKNLTKKFGDITSLNSISLTVKDGSVLGLIGTNGAGKSTLLRTLAGIYKVESGEAKIDGEEVFENNSIKANTIFVSDNQYLIPNFTLTDIANIYKTFYSNFSFDEFKKMCDEIGLDIKRKISTFSKGMKRQGEVLLAIASNTKYLLFDESFDGLDPIAREYVKKVIANAVCDRNCSVILSSHNLSEIESICDSVALISEGNLILHKSIEDALSEYKKYQIVFEKAPFAFGKIENVGSRINSSGKLITFISEKSEEEVEKAISDYCEENENSVVYNEYVGLSLEEIFTLEVEKSAEFGGIVK